MPSLSEPLEALAQPSGLPDVFMIQLASQDDIDDLFDDLPPPPLLFGRPITAAAAHPDFEDVIYVTTGPPEALLFLPDAALIIFP